MNSYVNLILDGNGATERVRQLFQSAPELAERIIRCPESFSEACAHSLPAGFACDNTAQSSIGLFVRRSCKPATLLT
jgi:hypothetical protein